MRISDWSSDVCSSDLAQDDAVKSDGTPYTATDLREIQDWIIKPQLRNVSGVTEINSIGGYNKEYQVAPLPARLSSYGLTMQDVVMALQRNNRTEEHTSELQSLMRISYAVFCLKKK